MAKFFKSTTSYRHSASAIARTGMTLCDVLDRTAENCPDKEAFIFISKMGSKMITYKQLRDDVIKLAAGLLHLGLKPGDRVGIWFENRYEWILSQYATAYAKMMYVRFLVGYNAEYMNHLVKKTKVSVLIVGSGNPEKVLKEMMPNVNKAKKQYVEVEHFPTLQKIIHVCQEEKPGMIRFDDILKSGEESDFKKVVEIRKTVHQDDEVTILFTSGSTGIPKAVVRSHRCFVENMNTFGRNIREVVSKDVRYMCVNPFAYAGADMGTVMTVIWAFTTIVLDPQADGSMIAEVIMNERVTASLFMYHILVDVIKQSRYQSYDFSSLGYIYTSGNIVPRKVLDTFRKLVTPNLFSMYGTTETGGPNTFNSNPERFAEPGYQLEHQEIKIIDEKGNIVPLKARGELCIRSPFVLLRYEGDEEKTKEDVDSSGWFHTGDICLMEEDGWIQVMGRKKDVIIKGGRNIYPMEVERILMRHPKVKMPQVVSVPDERMVEEICACICLEHDQEAKADDILEFVRPILEEYLVPKYVLFFEESFPSGNTGKIQRTELAKIARERLGLNE
ncbi:medium-chain acyl-CoA ligase ACSF2, mitochondrial-like [Glandiceps talaboti]